MENAGGGGRSMCKVITSKLTDLSVHSKQIYKLQAFAHQIHGSIPSLKVFTVRDHINRFFTELSSNSIHAKPACLCISIYTPVLQIGSVCVYVRGKV